MVLRSRQLAKELTHTEMQTVQIAWRHETGRGRGEHVQKDVNVCVKIVRKCDEKTYNSDHC